MSYIRTRNKGDRMNKESINNDYTFEKLHLFNTEDWKAIPECGVYIKCINLTVSR